MAGKKKEDLYRSARIAVTDQRDGVGGVVHGIMAWDPANNCGWAVYMRSEDGGYRLIDFGRLKPGWTVSDIARITKQYIARRIGADDGMWACVIETQYLGSNPSTLISLVEKRATIEAVCVLRGMQVLRVAAKSWQALLLKYRGETSIPKGLTKERSIRRALTLLTENGTGITDDEADAINIGDWARAVAESIMEDVH